MPIVTPWYVINKVGGLDDIFDSTVKRIVDDFEAYASSVALQAVWTNTLGAAAPTLETTDPIYGAKSLQVVVSATDVVGANLYDDSGPTYTDYTTEANSGVADSVILLPAAGAYEVDDAFYIGAYYPFKKCTINVSTVGVGVWEGVWEYWNGTAWTEVTVTDGTDGFTISGSHDVAITNLPLDWVKTDDSGNLSTSCFWLRYRLTTGDATPSARPKAAQIWIKYGAVSRDFANEMWGYFFPGNLRFLRFRATAVTQASDVIAIQRDASARYTLFRGYQFVIGDEPAREMSCELDSDSDLDCEGTTAWDQMVVDEIAWVFLDIGTFRLDQIEVYDDIAIMDRIGIGTEPATLDGVEGTVQSKLRTVFTKLDEILGETEQYVKFGPSLCELNFAYTWGLEIKAQGTAPVADYTIVPGVVDVKRLRLGTETDILTDQACSEADGRIYYQYTPTEADFALGDEIIMRFHDGETYEPIGTTWYLAANVAAIDTTLTFTAPQAFQFEVGDLLWLRDNATPAGQIVTVLTIDSPTQITLSAAVAAVYTTAQSVRVTKTIHTELEPAYCYASISRLPDINQEVEYMILSSFDPFDVAYGAPVATPKWTGENYTGGAEASTGSIAAGTAVVKADPDATPVATGYWLRHSPVITSKWFNVIVDLTEASWGTADASGAATGLAITAGTAFDANNHVMIRRYKDTTDNIVNVYAILNGVGVLDVDVAVTEDTLALRIERQGNTWRFYYSSFTYPSYVWNFVDTAQADDSSCYMGPNVSACVLAWSGGGADANTAQGKFDNFALYINQRSLETWIAGQTGFMEGGAQRSLADMPYIVASVDCNTSPQVDQDSMQVARIAIENLRHDTDLILTTEYATTVITIERYRQGLDTDWTAIVSGAAMTEVNGYVHYSYTFPAASWQDGDLIRYRISGTVVSIADQTFYVPEMTVHAVVGGISAIMKKLNLLQEVLFMSDFDLFDVAYAAAVNNERWTGSNFAGLAENSTANINTTTAGKAYVLADPDGTPAQTSYGLIHKPAHNGRHFDIIVDADYTWGTEAAGYLQGGLMVFKNAPTYDAQNYLFVGRQKSTTGATNNIVVDGKLNNVGITPASAAVTDDAIALRIERNENMWRFYYSLTKSPNYQWNLIAQVDDTVNRMSNEVSSILFASSPGSADTESIQVDFDNFKFYTNLGILEKLGYIIVSEGKLTTSSTTVPADTSQGVKVDNYYNGMLLMPIEGDCVGQTRIIVDFANGTGVFTLDPERPFTAAPGTSRYVILANQYPQLPVQNSTSNTMVSHVPGQKTDTPAFVASLVDSQMRYAKGALLSSGVVFRGIATAGSTTNVTCSDTTGLSNLIGFGDDFFNNKYWIQIIHNADSVGNAPEYEIRRVTDYDSNTGSFTVDAFTAAVAAGDEFLVLHEDYMFLRQSRGIEYRGIANTAVASTNTHTSAELIGFGEDLFNDKYFLEVVKNASGVGTAPEHEIRRITDYVSATGQFVTEDFTANVEAGDELLVLHETQVAPKLRGGLCFTAQVNETGGAATDVHLIELSGFGDGYFVWNWFVQVQYTTDGAAPVGEVQRVTGYTSLTGVFTTDAFTVALDAGDKVLVIHESLIALGRNDANNIFDSALVAGNQDGSILERLEFAQSHGASSMLGIVTVGASTTNITCQDLIGFGDDYFNGHYYMQVLKSSTGSPPQSQVRKITDYTSATGAFVTDAFGANVAVGDLVLILHESIIAVGRDDTDNTYASTNVVGNQDGSVLERLELAQSHGLAAVFGVVSTGGSDVTLAAVDLIGYGDDFFKDQYYVQVLKSALVTTGTTKKVTGYTSATGTFTFATFGANFTADDIFVVLHESLVAIGRNDADNEFDSSTVVSDEDGSLLERAEFIQTQLGYGVRLLTETAGGSTTLITAAEITEAAGWWKNAIILGIGGHNIGVCRPVISNTAGTITVYPALREANVVADTYLLISAYKPQVFEQQPDTPLNVSLVQGAAATSLFDLSTAGYSYELNSLRIKCADPSGGGATAQTVTIRLYLLINDVSVEVDNFTIDGTNYGTYFSLMDMFGEVKLTGDDILVTAELSAGATTPIALTGQYQHALIYTGAG